MNSSKLNVLIVDDEPIKRVALQIELSDAGYDVADAADAKIALDLLGRRPADVVVTDLRMPGMDGIAFLEEIRRRWPETSVIIMTAYGTVDTAVEAMKRGAYDYITKPFRTEALLEKLDRLRAYRQSAASPPIEEAFGCLAGVSRAIHVVFDQIRAAAEGVEHVHIVGEAGTGKTLVAETIHQLSGRRSSGLVRLNAEGMTEATAAAELFGVEADAASARRPGRLEQAAGGTLLLENVDRLGPAVQARLATAIEASAGARVISTATRPLLEAVRRGEFREDLYYRLSARTIALPSLRDRREDVPVLSRAFAQKHAALAGLPAGQHVGFSAHALDRLMAWHWPGNVLELEHAIEQALARCGGEEIRPEHLPPAICESDLHGVAVPLPEVGVGLNQTVSDVERMLIEAALRHSQGNQARAAQILKIPRTTLRDKMTKYGMVGDGAGA